MVERRRVLVGLSSAVLASAGRTRAGEARVDVVKREDEGTGPLAAALEPTGFRAFRGDGSEVATVYLARGLTRLDEGVFLGLVRLPSEGYDARERALPAGSYSLRYSTIPPGDRHDGCLRHPDFVVLLAVADETEATSRLTYDEMMTLSGRILGRRHPVVWQVRRGRGGAGPAALHEEAGTSIWLTVPLDLGGSSVPFSIYLRGSLGR
jgi:hypothetical protein